MSSITNSTTYPCDYDSIVVRSPTSAQLHIFRDDPDEEERRGQDESREFGAIDGIYRRALGNPTLLFI